MLFYKNDRLHVSHSRSCLTPWTQQQQKALFNKKGFIKMHKMVMVVCACAMLLTTVHHSSCQPLCGGDDDPYTYKLCLTVLEELLRRGPHQPDSEPAMAAAAAAMAEKYGIDFPTVDRGSKRQDVDHVFLRFGR